LWLAYAAVRSRAATLASCVLFLSGVVSACGSGSSDNGIALKSPNQIASSVTNATSTVKSVHVSGSIRNSGTPITLDLNLVAGKGGGGQMSQNGLSFQIISVGQEVYLKGSSAFWRHFGGAAAAQLFNGKWLRAPATGQFASIAELTNLQLLFNRLLSTHGTLAKGGTSTVAGQKVLAVNDTTQGGTLYIATTGKPYPVEIVRSGPQGGHIVFDRYDQRVALSAPANSIDISQFR
jgi:hypothetical protein